MKKSFALFFLIFSLLGVIYHCTTPSDPTENPKNVVVGIDMDSLVVLGDMAEINVSILLSNLVDSVRVVFGENESDTAIILAGGKADGEITIRLTYTYASAGNKKVSAVAFLKESDLQKNADFSVTVVSKPVIAGDSCAPVGIPYPDSSFGIFVGADGSGELSYIWYKNDSLFDSLSGDTLTFQSLSEQDTGVYYCLANNEWGVDTSAEYRLVLAELPVQQFDLVVAGSGMGNVLIEPAGGSYPAGTEVIITAVAADGRHFKAWDGAPVTGETDSVQSITMNQDYTIQAVFEQDAAEYTLVITSSGNGTTQLNPLGGVYVAGTNVALSAVADTGWHFKAWSGAPIDGRTCVQCTVAMNSNYALQAIFEQDAAEYSLATASSGQGNVEISPEETTYAGGAEVTLTAVPDSAW
ncbi:MAG: hypothetical protein GF401_11565, partial [Chitinivibrionales bacterium]|nr:hypothetical protein [Chitinivibrionales bacterium]